MWLAVSAILVGAVSGLAEKKRNKIEEEALADN